MILFTDIQEGDEAVTYLLQFGGIFLVGIFQLFESASGIYVVAGIDAHFLGILCRYISYFRAEVYIGHKRNHIAGTAQADIDVHQVFGLFHPLCSETDIFSAGIYNALCLGHTSLGVLCGGICHRLNTDRVGAAQRNGPNIHFRSFPSGVVE